MSEQIAFSVAGPYELLPGNAMPYGASLTEQGCNFSIYCPDAEEVFICLFDEQERPLAQVALVQRIQSKWFGVIRSVKAGQLYGIRVRPKQRKQFIDFSVEKLLIDPYAKALNRQLDWDAKAYQGDSHAMVPKCVVLSEASHTNAQHQAAPYSPLVVPANERIVYEAHVKGMTMLHPDVPDELKGTYLGACHDSIIKHLKSLGVRSVQFLPLMSFMPEPFAAEKGLTNYWGYNPINFFAPEPRYAFQDALSECKHMLKTYRDEGFEVILDVVFNHTAEAGHHGAVLSFKGLCASHAYLLEQNDESDQPEFVNYSGCGNTVKVSDTYMQNLILDAMRYWVSEMGVSGFRFDLAATLGREQFEFRSNASLFKMIQQDPILKHAVLIAEPWDIGPGGYQLGHFPASWLEVNDKFRDCVRGFWRGDKGLKGEFATRLMGSRDVFRKTVRPMSASVNNVTYHDGYTLHDLVSYEQKHNLANLEENRDGHGHNLSRNYGVEGETLNPEILAIREQQKRNMFATLILSQGTPHVLGGDELSRSQKGNNNAYCQDNELNYYNWRLNERQQAFLDFCRYVIDLRQRHPLLQQMHFADDQFSNQENIEQVEWYRRDGSHTRDIDWVNHEHHCFALHICGRGAQHADLEQWVYCINSADTAKQFTLDVLSDSATWECVLDTACQQHQDCQQAPIHGLFEMPAFSLRLFKNKGKHQS
ncbi:glycogen debranching protein GlgX [Glaciecola siphonariae]|uniref:Glycogen debranching protein GlgX n=1 Tax=Glaciecola siphonariae TaxID=521012 RepID=A0ABV9LVH7_9ALTE